MLPDASRMNRILGFTTVPLVELPSGVVVRSVSAAWLEYIATLHIARIADVASLGNPRRVGCCILILLSEAKTWLVCRATTLVKSRGAAGWVERFSFCRERAVETE